ncbi:MAG: hypothetical protein GAK29_00041 [Acinetobacter bereziniae]|uniref:Uncharacterized protein n=2 Tax=Acinetobacter TaxID=469 RepID=A0A833UTR0_ACIBZ|nr:MAG: hypothetical protein GAK29_00041 [Acinetobacter bereziniae]
MYQKVCIEKYSETSEPKNQQTGNNTFSIYLNFSVVPENENSIKLQSHKSADSSFMLKLDQSSIGNFPMSRPVLSFISNQFSKLGRTVLIASTLMGTAQFAVAGPTVDQLSDCLVKATTATDKTTVLQWTFAALSAHPDLKALSNVSDAQRTQLDQKFAQVLQRVIVEQCSAQAKAVIQTEGLQAIGDSFQELGRSTGEDIVKNPEVKKQLQGVLRYVDLNKLVMTFLTPDIWNKLGTIRQ